MDVPRGIPKQKRHRFCNLLSGARKRKQKPSNKKIDNKNNLNIGDYNYDAD